MASEAADPIERWTAKRRVTLVVSILKGETSVAEAARTHGLTVAEGVEALPFGPEDIRRVRGTLSGVSERRSCQVLGVSRAGLHRTEGGKARRPMADPPWVERLHQLIQQYPTFGYRRLWVLLRVQNGIIVNRKAVYRILKQKGWCVHQRVATPRPRVQGWTSRGDRSNERWAMDVTHIPCGQDGWAHLAAVIDCHDREVIGYEFALRSRAKEAERAVEAACLQRFGTLRPVKAPVLRSDNGRLEVAPVGWTVSVRS
jgi:putative transposase